MNKPCGLCFVLASLKELDGKKNRPEKLKMFIKKFIKLFRCSHLHCRVEQVAVMLA